VTKDLEELKMDQKEKQTSILRDRVTEIEVYRKKMLNEIRAVKSKMMD
jgi:hypothetical protein